MTEAKKEDVVIRRLRKKDLPEVVKWNRDPELAVYFDGKNPLDVMEAETLYAKERRRANRKNFIMEVGGRLIGDLALFDIKWKEKEAEIYIRIGEKGCWNKGFGTQAIRKILEKGFSELKLERVFLRVYDFNLRAIRCYEKCGFKKIGILRRTRPITREKAWKNIILMAITKERWQKIQQKTLPGSRGISS